MSQSRTISIADQEIPEEVSAYLLWLKAERRMASGSVANYHREMQRLITLKAAQSFDTLDAHQIRRFVATLHGQGLHARSIAYALSVWRGFFDWSARAGKASLNPVRGIRAPKSTKPRP
jgi:integrase/recombinase XerC